MTSLKDVAAQWFTKYVNFRRLLLIAGLAIALALIFSEGVAKQLGVDNSGVEALLKEILPEVRAGYSPIIEERLVRALDDVKRSNEWNLTLLGVGILALVVAGWGCILEFKKASSHDKLKAERDDLWDTDFKNKLLKASEMDGVAKSLTTLGREFASRLGLDGKADFWVKIARWKPDKGDAYKGKFVMVSWSDNTPESEFVDYSLMEGEGGVGDYVQEIKRCMASDSAAFTGKYYSRNAIETLTPKRLRHSLSKSPIQGELCLPVFAYSPKKQLVEGRNGGVYMKGVICFCSSAGAEVSQLNSDMTVKKLKEWAVQLGASLHKWDSGRDLEIERNTTTQ